MLDVEVEWKVLFFCWRSVIHWVRLLRVVGSEVREERNDGRSVGEMWMMLELWEV